MIGRIAAQMLDPYFVREEELAAIMDRRPTEIAYRKWINTEIGILGAGNIQIQVPAGYQWWVVSVIANEPTDAGVGATEKRLWLTLSDENDRIYGVIGANALPATYSQSTVTWGIDLDGSIHNNGQLPPSYQITAKLPRIPMREYYRIRCNRDTVGGIPVTDATFRILYFEEKLVV